MRTETAAPDKQTDRPPDKQTEGKQNDRLKSKPTERQTYACARVDGRVREKHAESENKNRSFRQTNRQSKQTEGRQKDRQESENRNRSFRKTDRTPDKQTEGKQNDRQTGRKTERQTYAHARVGGRMCEEHAERGQKQQLQTDKHARGRIDGRTDGQTGHVWKARTETAASDRHTDTQNNRRR